MRKSTLLILASIITLSCNSKTQEIANHFSFNELVSDSNNLIIKLYDTTATEKLSRNLESFIPKKEFKVSEIEIKDFENMIEKAESTGYCCCPTAVYSITFLKGKKELDVFYLDTLEFKDRIRIYQGSYQFSYIIEKQKWKSFLNQVSN